MIPLTPSKHPNFYTHVEKDLKLSSLSFPGKSTQLVVNIANRGEWLWSQANIKRTNSDGKIYSGEQFTTVHNLLFCVVTICVNYVTKKFLFVSSSVCSEQLLCFVHGRGQEKKTPGIWNMHPRISSKPFPAFCHFQPFRTSTDHVVKTFRELPWPFSTGGVSKLKVEFAPASTCSFERCFC